MARGETPVDTKQELFAVERQQANVLSDRYTCRVIAHHLWQIVRKVTGINRGLILWRCGIYFQRNMDTWKIWLCLFIFFFLQLWVAAEGFTSLKYISAQCSGQPPRDNVCGLEFYQWLLLAVSFLWRWRESSRSQYFWKLKGRGFAFQ